MSRVKVAAVAVTLAATAFVGGRVSNEIDPLPLEAESSELVEYQARCTLAHAFHDQYIARHSKRDTGQDMRFTDGEAHRPADVAALYAKQGRGIATSLHTQRLARDKMLILNGKYTPRAEDYEYAGLVWEAIGKPFGVETAWGGRFNDANHFSCAWGGRK